MTTKPSGRAADKADGAPLNPALKEAKDSTYGADQQGTDPMDTVSVQKDEGTAWPMIWAVTVIACVIITILLLVF
ncbi:hypothetical protein [Geminicoccus roseus]|uniref:hypothetical protein n=1 Tax=Geminicoccus roseus TaxID=404900 RepID=UPI0012F75F84|nr:hypothetical protein [Geminicoccus roseus]